MYDGICVWGCLVCINLEYLVTILKITADSIVDCTVCVRSERARMYCVNGNKTVGVYSNCCVVCNSFRHTCAKARDSRYHTFFAVKTVLSINLSIEHFRKCLPGQGELNLYKSDDGWLETRLH